MSVGEQVEHDRELILEHSHDRSLLLGEGIDQVDETESHHRVGQRTCQFDRGKQHLRQIAEREPEDGIFEHGARQHKKVCGNRSGFCRDERHDRQRKEECHARFGYLGNRPVAEHRRGCHHARDARKDEQKRIKIVHMDIGHVQGELPVYSVICAA